MEITLNDDPELSGIGLTIFFAGCPHKCEGCHNPRSWDSRNGDLIDKEEIEEKIRKSSTLIKSVCFCGGEPLLYKEALVDLTKFCRSYGLKVILYTGYLFEEIDKDIIHNVDTIIDGKYVEELESGTFPASDNQRVFIDGQQINPKELQINIKSGGTI